MLGKGVEELTEDKVHEPSIKNDQEYSEHLPGKNDRERVGEISAFKKKQSKETGACATALT